MCLGCWIVLCVKSVLCVIGLVGGTGMGAFEGWKKASVEMWFIKCDDTLSTSLFSMNGVIIRVSHIAQYEHTSRFVLLTRCCAGIKADEIQLTHDKNRCEDVDVTIAIFAPILITKKCIIIRFYTDTCCRHEFSRAKNNYRIHSY